MCVCVLSHTHMYTQCLSFLVRSCQGFHNSNYKSIPADFSRDHSWYIVGEWRYPNCPYIFYAHNVLGPEIRLHGREHNLHSYASKILKGQQEREHITFSSFLHLKKVEFGFGIGITDQFESTEVWFIFGHKWGTSPIVPTKQALTT